MVAVVFEKGRWIMQGSIVPAHSQEYKVKEALVGVGASHNTELVANFVNVRVGVDGLVYFCTSRFALASEVKPGDGGVLPDRVRLEGDWEFPNAGYYEVRNARVVVNGAISLIKEPETEVVFNRQSEHDWSYSLTR
jgi:hypothetical protein